LILASAVRICGQKLIQRLRKIIGIEICNVTLPCRGLRGHVAQKFYPFASKILANPVIPIFLDVPRFKAAGTHAWPRRLICLKFGKPKTCAAAFEGFRPWRRPILCPSPLLFTHPYRITRVALGARLPTMHTLREYVRSKRSDILCTKLAGPVAARAELYRQDFAGLRKPSATGRSSRPSSDLTYQPTTAKALGLTSRTFLLRANELIE